MAQNFKDYKSKRERETVLWKDRKRFLGLPLSFTRYSITATRLQVKKGFFNSRSDDVLLYRILDTEVSASFGQKLCGVGTVKVYAADKSTPSLELKNIKQAELVADYLSDLVEEVKDAKRITGREMFGAGTIYPVPGDIDGDGIPDMAPPPPATDFDAPDGPDYQ